jgi:DNA-binding CsgD family transcriptional regulator
VQVSAGYLMLSPESLSHLISLIYDAAQRREAWDCFLERLAAATKSTQVTLFVHDARHHEYGFVHKFPPETQQLHTRYDAERDEWLKRARGMLHPGVVVARHKFCPEDEFVKAEFFNEYLKSGAFYQFGGSIHQDAWRLALVSLLRPKRSGPYSESDLQLLRTLMPHLGRATNINNTLVDLRSRAEGLAEAIDHLPLGIALLDSDGRPVLFNATARTIFAANDVLIISGNRVRAVYSKDDDRLTTMMRRAVGIGNDSIPTGSVIAMSRRNGRPLTITVSPTRSTGLEAPVVAAIFISDPDQPIRTDLHKFAKLYGTTPSEARIATLLLNGKTLNDAAKLLGVSRHTVRSQLKSVLHKTGSSRQSDLVKLLLSVSLPNAA